MTRPIIKIAGVEREMNDDELKQYELDQIENQKRIEFLEAKEKSKAAILEKLGLTENEIKILFS